MHKTGTLNGDAPLPQDCFLLSEFLICDSNRQYIENWPRQPNLERDTQNTYLLV